jgi:replication-associated recombination protein RarA
MGIIGHEKIVSFFNKVIDNGALSQSYCFVGVEGVGKKTTARYLAAKILKITEKQLDTHPDFYFICRQIDEKTEKIKKDISAAQAKQIKEKLGRKSWFGGYQVVVIDEAELLNEESGNALLKNLEEAGGQRVFFLLTSNDSGLLPTISSRCQMFYFSVADAKTIEAGLVKLGYAGALATEAAKLSWGRPGRAVMLAADDQLRQNFSAEAERWQKIEDAPFYQKLKAVEDLFDDRSTIAAGAAQYGAGKVDNLRVSEKLSNALEIWTVLWRDKLLEKLTTKDQSLKPKVQPSTLQMAGLIDDFKKAQILLAQNINPRLVIEQILLKV